jgi:hypothetical protein
MQVVYQRCAGLDVHKQTVVVCLLITQGNGSVQEQVRTFGTMTADLATLSHWLVENQVEQVAHDQYGRVLVASVQSAGRGGARCGARQSAAYQSRAGAQN